jgi:hypothetical protein
MQPVIATIRYVGRATVYQEGTAVVFLVYGLLLVGETSHLVSLVVFASSTPFELLASLICSTNLAIGFSGCYAVPDSLLCPCGAAAGSRGIDIAIA